MLSPVVTNFFGSVISYFRVIYDFISMLVKNMGLMSDVADVATEIPNTVSSFIWSPIAVSMGVAIAYLSIKLIVRVVT